jgi:hypothetical protein
MIYNLVTDSIPELVTKSGRLISRRLAFPHRVSGVATIATAANSKFRRKLADLVIPRSVAIFTVIDAPFRPRCVQPILRQSLTTVDIVNYVALGRKHLRVVVDLSFMCLDYHGKL